MRQLKQPKINTSFPRDDQDLYNQLIRESNLSYVPAAPLVRKYVRKGMEVENAVLATA